MIVLDTNVLSELMRPTPEPRVLEWVDSVPVRHIAITAVTVAEILYGIGRMPNGRRRRELRSAAEVMFDQDFHDRILGFDAEAAVEYAAVVIAKEASGRPMSMADAQIAAVCRVHQCTLAKRNESDFEGTGVKTMNPWSHGASEDEESFKE